MRRKQCIVRTLGLLFISAWFCLPAWAGTWREDFTVPHEWWQWLPDRVVENGVLDWKSPAGWLTGSSLPEPLGELKNFVIKMKIQFVDFPEKADFPGDAPRQAGIGIVVRQQLIVDPPIPDVGYIVNFFTDLDLAKSRATISRAEVNAARGKKFIDKDLPTPIAPGVWYDLTVVTQGNDISFRVNPNFEISVTDKDNPFLSGGIFLYLVSAHVRIDYIEVSGPEVPGLGVGPKSKLTTMWGKIKASR